MERNEGALEKVMDQEDEERENREFEEFYELLKPQC
jgi:hypothetical protein